MVEVEIKTAFKMQVHLSEESNTQVPVVLVMWLSALLHLSHVGQDRYP